MAQLQLPSGKVVTIDDRLSPADQFRQMVSQDPSLQKRYGVEQSKGVLGDVPKELTSGLGQMVAGGAWAMGKMGQLLGHPYSDILQVGQGKGKPKSTVDQALGNAFTTVSTQNQMALSPGQTQADLDPNILNPRKLYGMAVQSAPSLALSAVTGGGGALLSGGDAAAIGLTGKAAASHVAAGAAKAAMASEAMQSASQTGQQTDMGVRQWIEQNPQAFLNSPTGKKAMKEAGGDFDKAVNSVAGRAGLTGAGLAGVITPLASAVTGDFTGKVLSNRLTHGIVGSAAEGFAKEGVEEALQSGGEQFAQNVGLNVGGLDTPLTQGVGTAAIQGGLTGAATGGALGGAFAAPHAIEQARFQSGLQDIRDWLQTNESQRFQQMKASAQSFGLVPDENGQLQTPAPEQQDLLQARREMADKVFTPAFEKAGLDTRMASQVVDFIAGPTQDSFGEGLTTHDENQNPLIKVAVGLYDQNVSEDQFAKAIAGIGNHEIVHGAIESGVISPQQQEVLLDEAKRRKFVDPDTGKALKGTYFEWALAKYGQQDEAGNLSNPDEVNEEAIAELGRAQSNMEKPNSIAYRNYLDRLKQTYRLMTKGLDNATKLYNDLYSGELVGRANIDDGHKAVGELADQMDRERAQLSTQQQNQQAQERQAQAADAGNLDEVLSGEPNVQAGENPAEEPTQAAEAPEEHPTFEVDEEKGPPDDQRFSFVGVKSQTLPTENLIKFAKDEQRGRHPASLYKETGLWRGKDGQVRYEISDHNAELMEPSDPDATITKLPEILHHPELYAAYPMLRGMNVIHSKSEGMGGGHFSMRDGTIVMGDMPDMDTAKTVLLHEIQHAIQTIEGHAPGGSPDLVKQQLADHADQEMRDMLSYQPKMSQNQHLERYWGGRNTWVAEATYLMSKLPERDEAGRQAVFERAAKKAWGHPQSRYAKEDFQDEIYKQIVYNTYRHIHGEVEAVDTEKRMDMTPAERKANSPLRNEKYERGIVLPPFPIERAPWIVQGEIEQAAKNRFSFVRDTSNTPNTVPATTAEIPDPEDYGPVLGDAKSEALGKQLALQHTALSGPLKVLLSPTGLRVGGKMGVYWDSIAVDRIKDNLITNLQSETWPLKQFIWRAVKLGGKITDRSDPVAMQILFHGRVKARLDSALNQLYKPMAKAIAQIGASESHLKELAKVSPLAQALSEVKELTPGSRLMELYLYARHAPERNAWIAKVRQPPVMEGGKPKLDDQGNPVINQSGSGMSDDESQAIMDWFSKSDLLPKVKEAATIADAIVRSTNRVRLMADLIPDWKEVVQRNPEAEALIPDWKYYVPLRGITEGAVDEEDDSPLKGILWDKSAYDTFMNKGSGYSVRGREDQRVKGRGSYAGGLVENMLRQHEHAVVRAQKNQIGLSFLKFVQDNQSIDGMKDLIIVNPPERRIPVVDSNTGKVRLGVDQNWKNEKDVYSVKVKGADVHIIINDQDIARSLKEMSNLGDGLIQSVSRAMRPVTQLISKAMTTWNLEFPLGNAPRDVQEASIRGAANMGSRSLKIAPRMLQFTGGLMRERITKSHGEMTKLFEEMENLGAFTGTYGLKGYEETLNMLQNEIRRASSDTMTLMDKITWLPRQGAKLVEGINDVVEAGTRMAVYQTAREHGYSKLRAAQLAKTTTINFNERGRWGPQLGSLYALSNARIQGTANSLSGLASKAVWKMLLGYAGMGLLSEIWNTMVGGDDPDKNAYEKIMREQQYVADRNIILLNPWDHDDNGLNRYMVVPKAPGFGVFFDLGRMMYRATLGKTDPGSAAINLLGNFADNFNPTGFRATWAGVGAGIVPSAGRPLYDVATNEDWTKMPVHPTALPFGVQAGNFSQHFANTPAWAVGMAKGLSDISGGEGDYLPGFIDMHPDSIDSIVTGYLGGIYTTGMRLNRLVARGLGQKDLPGAREQTINDVPFARRFYGEVTSVTNRKYFDQYVDHYVRLDKQQKLLAEQSPEGYEAFSQRHEKELAVAPTAVSYAAELVALNRAIKSVSDDPQMSDAEKVVQLKELKDNQEALLNEGIHEIESQEKSLGIHRSR
jgi:hypothetical protein